MRVGFTCLSFLFVSAFVCAACGPATSSVVPVAGPDGQSGWLEVNCPGNPRRCHELASDTCPNGYNTEDFRLGSASRYASPSAMEEPIGPPDKSGQMLITCKGGSGPAPATTVVP